MGIVAVVVVAVVVVARSQNVTSAKRGRGTRYVAGAPSGYATPNCQTCRVEEG